MNAGMKDGKIVIDMAEADALWKSLTKDAQYDMMCALFDPMLAKATKMQRALIAIQEAAEQRDVDACRELSRLGLADPTTEATQ